MSLDPSGFYEVKVHYEHVSRLASGCGITNFDIEQEILADNQQRQEDGVLKAQQAASGTEIENPEGEDYDLSRFDLDPNDELSSDEELC